jgi:tetratricopeptide (TPR) repeat protein
VETDEQQSYIQDHLLKSDAPLDVAYGHFLSIYFYLHLPADMPEREGRVMLEAETLMAFLENSSLPRPIRIKLYINLAKVYSRIWLVQKEITALKRGYHLLDKVEDFPQIYQYDMPGNIGRAYGSLGMLDSAIHYYDISMDYIRRSNISTFEASAKANSYGFFLYRNGKSEQAIPVLLKAFTLYDSIRLSTFGTSIMDNLALCYKALDNTDSAKYWHYQNLEQATRLGMRRRKAKTLLTLGKVYIDQDSLVMAKNIF